MKRLIRGLFKLTFLVGLGYLVYRLIAEKSALDREVSTPPPAPPRPTRPEVPRPTTKAGTAPQDTRPKSGPAQPATANVRSIGVGEVPEHIRKWVEPDADGSCPESHPVKAKLESGIFHVPGGRFYNRVHPDRCYRDAASAEADGLRASKQ